MKEFKNKKGQVIGSYNEEQKIYRKRVRFSKHFFRMRDSWGIDKSVSEELRQLGCEQIRILDEERNIIYAISFNDFYEKAILDKWGDEDHQFFCQRQHFTIEKV